MNLVQEYSTKAVVGLALVSALSLTGCANQKFAQNNTEIGGGIPVGRVVTQTANQNLKTFKEDAIKRPIQGATRFTACPLNNQPAQVAQPKEDAGFFGNLFGGLVDAGKKAILPTTTLSIGDAGCTGNQGILPAPGASGERPGPRPR